jgi:hypothetical protein
MSRSQDITVQLAFIPANSQFPDPITANELARSTFNELSKRGYIILPVYTGERGGSLYDISMQIAQALYSNRELITEIVKFVTPIVTLLMIMRKERTEQENDPPSVTVTIDDRSTVVQEADVESDQALLERLLQEHPELSDTTTLDSLVKITIDIPLQGHDRRK